MPTVTATSTDGATPLDCGNTDLGKCGRRYHFASIATVTLLILVLALAQWRLMLSMCDIEGSVRDSHSIVVGQAEWYVYQNRVLAPLLIKWLGDDLNAFRDLTLVGLILAGWLSWRVGGLTALMTMQAGFALLLTHEFKPWDILELPIMMAFVALIVAGKNRWWFFGLFVVAILNRQSAQFIAFWLVADPVVKWLLVRTAKFDVASAVLGFAAIPFGMVVTEAIDRISGRKPDATTEEVGNVFHFRWGNNLHDMKLGEGAWRHLVNSEAPPIFLLTLIISLTALAMFIAYRNPKRFGGLAVTYLAMLGAVLMFGMVRELRVYIDFIPLMVVAVNI